MAAKRALDGDARLDELLVKDCVITLDCNDNNNGLVKQSYSYARAHIKRKLETDGVSLSSDQVTRWCAASKVRLTEAIREARDSRRAELEAESESAKAARVAKEHEENEKERFHVGDVVLVKLKGYGDLLLANVVLVDDKTVSVQYYLDDDKDKIPKNCRDLYGPVVRATSVLMALAGVRRFRVVAGSSVSRGGPAGLRAARSSRRASARLWSREPTTEQRPNQAAGEFFFYYPMHPP
jgi:hypothetical protein